MTQKLPNLELNPELTDVSNGMQYLKRWSFDSTVSNLQGYFESLEVLTERQP